MLHKLRNISQSFIPSSSDRSPSRISRHMAIATSASRHCFGEPTSSSIPIPTKGFKRSGKLSMICRSTDSQQSSTITAILLLVAKSHDDLIVMCAGINNILRNLKNCEDPLHWFFQSLLIASVSGVQTSENLSSYLFTSWTKKSSLSTHPMTYAMQSESPCTRLGLVHHMVIFFSKVHMINAG